jgi:hypothetical protein
MKKMMKKKLTLNRETLHSMEGDPLAAVAGGFQTRIGTCISCYQVCSLTCPSAACYTFNTCPSTPDLGC